MLGITLREVQLEVVKEIIEFPNQSFLLLAPTGWGKTLCFTIPPLVCSSSLLLVSPLISLLEEQIRTFRDSNFFVINLREDPLKDKIFLLSVTSALSLKRPFVLVTTPEKLFHDNDVAEFVISVFGNVGSLKVVLDEVHVIPTWGLGFRGVYPVFLQKLNRLRNISFILCSATLPYYFYKPLKCILNVDSIRIFDFISLRPSVSFSSFSTKIFPETLESTEIKVISHIPDKFVDFFISEFLQKYLKDRVVIVFLNNRVGVECFCLKLQDKGIDCDFYHSKLDQTTKKNRVLRWNAGNPPVMVATSALSLGINNKLLTAVVHIGYSAAASLIEFVQEIGRCCRTTPMMGDSILLSSGDSDYFQLIKRISYTDPVSIMFNNDALILYGFWSQNMGCQHYLLYNFFRQEFVEDAVTDFLTVNCKSCTPCKMRKSDKLAWNEVDAGQILKFVEASYSLPGNHTRSILLLSKLLCGVVEDSIVKENLHKIRGFGSLRKYTVQHVIVLTSILILLKIIRIKFSLFKSDNTGKFAISEYRLHTGVD